MGNGHQNHKFDSQNQGGILLYCAGAGADGIHVGGNWEGGRGDGG